MKAHPELRQILNDFLSSCLLEQPENVYEYAKQYFSFFNYQKDVIRHKPLVISGCSGVGKGTLINFLLEKFPDIFELSISYTTRRPRQGEVHGREYYFVEKEEFIKEIEKDVFAEYCQVHDNYYGTHQGKLNEIINKGKVIIFLFRSASWILICRGLKKSMPNCLIATSCLSTAPSSKILRKDSKKGGHKLLSKSRKGSKTRGVNSRLFRNWSIMSTS